MSTRKFEAAIGGKKKEKKYAVQDNTERPFITLDREVFSKSDDEKSDLLNHKQRIKSTGGVIKRHKFQTLVISQF